MNDDALLLRRYAEEKSDGAFAEFVRRRVDLVYAVALRKVGGDMHLAEDVAQQIFSDVAKKAAALAQHPALTGWLFRSTHYVATQMVRTERRRRAREENAETMKQLLQDDGTTNEIDWERMRPLLDDLVNELSERDRAAVLGRFFEELPLAEIGLRLHLSEAGAQSRVERAVEKLRAALARRGVTSSATALSVALANQAGATAPASLAASVTASALAGVASVSTTPALVVFMGATKTAFTGSAFLSVAAVLLLSSIGVSIHQAQAARVAETKWVAAHTRYKADDAELARLARTASDAQQRIDEAKAQSAASRAALARLKAAANSGPISTPAPRDPRADGKAFLAAIGEEGRKNLLEAMRTQFQVAYAMMNREAGLSAAQVSQLGSRHAQYWIDHLIVTPSDIGPDPDHNVLSDDELRAILGQEAFRKWDLAGNKSPGIEWVMGLAVRIMGDASAEPLTTDQMSALANIVANHSPEFRAGAEVDLDTVEWNAVAPQAQAMLTAAQWRQAQSWLLKKELERELAVLKANGKR